MPEPTQVQWEAIKLVLESRGDPRTLDDLSTEEVDAFLLEFKQREDQAVNQSVQVFAKKAADPYGLRTQRRSMGLFAIFIGVIGIAVILLLVLNR